MHYMLAQLNRRLARHGEEVVLHRPTSAGPNGSHVQARVPAIVRVLTVEQLIGSISQTSFLIIISPWHLIQQQQWPGGRPVVALSNSLIAPTDARLPTTNDKVWVRGSQKAITRSAPVFNGGECIRVELTVLG